MSREGRKVWFWLSVRLRNYLTCGLVTTWLTYRSLPCPTRLTESRIITTERGWWCTERSCLTPEIFSPSLFSYVRRWCVINSLPDLMNCLWSNNLSFRGLQRTHQYLVLRGHSPLLRLPVSPGRPPTTQDIHECGSVLLIWDVNRDRLPTVHSYTRVPTV